MQTILYSKLQEQFNPKTKNKIGFSLNFTPVHTFGNGKIKEKDNFVHPLDVKISHQFHCVIITDRDRIQVFDLHSRKFKKSIQFQNYRINYLNIEKINQKEYLYVTSMSPSVLFKFDLEQLLLSNNEPIENLCIWKVENLNHPSTVEILYRDYHENQILVSDMSIGRIHVLDSITGMKVQDILASTPYGIASLNSNSFLVGDACNDNIHIYERNENQEFQKSSSFDFSDKSRPSTGIIGFDSGGLLFDPIEKNILIVNIRKSQICAFKQENRSLIKTFKSGMFSYGMCLDQYTGELYVCTNDKKMNTQSSACKSGKTCCSCSSNEANSNGAKALNIPSSTSLPPSNNSSTPSFDNKQSSHHHCNQPCCLSKTNQESPSSQQTSISTNLLTTQNPNSYSTVTSPSYHHSFTQSHLHSEEHIEPSDLNEIKPVDETNKQASEATSNYFKIVFGSSINEPACGTSKGSCECSGCNYSVGQSNRGAAIVAIQAHLPPTPRGSSNTSKRGGGCKGSSSSGSVKIQKKSVMQNKLKNQLTRMRDSTVDVTMHESDKVAAHDDSGIIVSTN
ncbi:predicted protein [Naegleria gruberi]|uniref:Predicted protein n=1 Tax=Naegleria gruberi TaxID=5762 RepID=D2VS74_NAEGR|nr:uncharacterized protein NAEGRDRAFT_51841 [Naegleria gruberi]EFC40292.1 predicted protein [Naegleria gruberi]|eukprot:XP_002673036.1 predicted protein [Naegleria gruberi strain NEG-M]